MSKVLTSESRAVLNLIGGLASNAFVLSGGAAAAILLEHREEGRLELFLRDAGLQSAMTLRDRVSPLIDGLIGLGVDVHSGVSGELDGWVWESWKIESVQVTFSVSNVSTDGLCHPALHLGRLRIARPREILDLMVCNPHSRIGLSDAIDIESMMLSGRLSPADLLESCRKSAQEGQVSAVLNRFARPPIKSGDELFVDGSAASHVERLAQFYKAVRDTLGEAAAAL